MSTETIKNAILIHEGEGEYGPYFLIRYLGKEVFINRDNATKIFINASKELITLTIPYSLYEKKFEQ